MIEDSKIFTNKMDFFYFNWKPLFISSFPNSPSLLISEITGVHFSSLS